MTKSASRQPDTRQPVVTVSTRKKNPGFTNPNKGIPVAKGLHLQDVPREIIQRHMRETENYWKVKFSQQYGGSHGGHQSF